MNRPEHLKDFYAFELNKKDNRFYAIDAEGFAMKNVMLFILFEMAFIPLGSMLFMNVAPVISALILFGFPIHMPLGAWLVYHLTRMHYSYPNDGK